MFNVMLRKDAYQYVELVVCGPFALLNLLHNKTNPVVPLLLYEGEAPHHC